MPSTPRASPPLSRLPTLALLQGLADLHQSVLVADDQGRVVWMSDELGVLRGEREEVVGTLARQLFVGGPRLARLADQFRETGRITNVRVELARRRGAAVPVEVSAVRVPVAVPGGHYNVAILRPLEERERRDRQLRETVRYFRAILDGSSEAVVALDRRGFITYANPAAARMIGVGVDELIDQPLALVFSDHPVELQRIAAALRPVGDSHRADVDLPRRGGGRVCVSVSASCIRLEDGSTAGSVAFVRDVTQRRRFEEELARKNAELEHYVHAVSHDLRTPLVSLLGFSRLLAEDYAQQLDDTGRHFVERIVQAARTMEHLISDLLELSRIGQARGQRALVNPLEVLNQLRAELKPRLDERGIELCLPESASLVLCDRTQLYQLFANLLSNAVEHMGDVADPRITVRVSHRADRDLLCVSDNGLGIAPEHHERIFELFQTLGPRGGEGRTGVGLAIVKKIAETHGGRVWVESRPGGGASFHVELPRR